MAAMATAYLGLSYSQGVYPAQPNGPYLQDNSQLLCLDTLLTFVNHLSGRLEPQGDRVGLRGYPCLSDID